MSAKRKAKRRRTKPLTRGEKVCAFIERHCIVPEGMLVGQPIELAPFQRRFILDVYDNPHGTRQAILSMGRKNAKTATIAALALAHLVGPEAVPNSEIVSGARSRDQAGQVYRYASKMARMSPTLRQIVKPIPSQKTLVGLPVDTMYHAIAAEAGTAHGGSPIVAILDEVGQVRGPRDDFIDAIKTSQGAYENPLRIIISTQAATDQDLLSILLDDAEQSESPTTVCHLYTAPEDCELLDESAWEAANPAIDRFRSRDDIRELAEEAERMPSAESSFRNLILNQRVSTTSPFVSQSVWKANTGSPPGRPNPELPVWAGLDLSSHADLTSLEVIQQDGEIWNVWSYMWTPEEGLVHRSRRDRTPYEQWVKDGYLLTTPGATVDYEHVAADMKRIFADLLLVAIGFDRWRIRFLLKELERQEVELPLVDFGQGFKSMAPALDTIEKDFLNGRLAHGGHPVLTMCAANAVVTMDPTGNRKLNKAKATGRIDGMVALVMARGVAELHEPEEPSVYETRGVIEIDL